MTIRLKKRKGSGRVLRFRAIPGHRVVLLLWLVLLLFLIMVLSFPKWVTFFYPLPHREYVFNYANQFRVDPYLVFAIIRAESEFKTQAQSARGARGLMQIMPETARWISEQMNRTDFEEEELDNPQVNIEMGCWYIADLIQEFGGRLPLAVAAYNAGRGNVRKWLVEGIWDGRKETVDDIPFAETKRYVKVVLTDYEIYRTIYSSQGYR